MRKGEDDSMEERRGSNFLSRVVSRHLMSWSSFHTAGIQKAKVKSVGLNSERLDLDRLELERLRSKASPNFWV
jgi:hypothetical protein